MIKQKWKQTRLVAFYAIILLHKVSICASSSSLPEEPTTRNLASTASSFQPSRIYAQREDHTRVLHPTRALHNRRTCGDVFREGTIQTGLYLRQRIQWMRGEIVEGIRNLGHILPHPRPQDPMVPLSEFARTIVVRVVGVRAARAADAIDRVIGNLWNRII
jgi:hypothetical protein